MEYAAVWMEDKSGIVQIGMEPKRLLKQMEEKPEKVVSEIPSGLMGYLHIINTNTGKIEASTVPGMNGLDIHEELKTEDKIKLLLPATIGITARNSVSIQNITVNISWCVLLCQLIRCAARCSLLCLYFSIYWGRLWPFCGLSCGT